MSGEDPGDAWRRFAPIRLDEANRNLDVLNQTCLPFTIERLRLATVDACAAAIRSMVVRGAPLIGITAAGGMALAVQTDTTDRAIDTAATMLLAARPTAVNLRWAVKQMCAVLLDAPVSARAALAWSEAHRIAQAEYDCCERIGMHGVALLRKASDLPAARARGRLEVLTHCNAGWLATGAWGTALAPVYRAHREGIPLHVWVDETRPRNQGARLTAWELAAAGVPHTLIADNAAAHLMQRGRVDLCIVGSDRTTAAGDVCNKIGTYARALAAADNGVPFHVALPVSTIDWTLMDGIAGIPIEERDAAEVLEVEGLDAEGVLRSVRAAPANTTALNPAFDVTPARLINSLICEHGVFAADATALAALRAVAAAAGGRV